MKIAYRYETARRRFRRVVATTWTRALRRILLPGVVVASAIVSPKLFGQQPLQRLPPPSTVRRISMEATVEEVQVPVDNPLWTLATFEEIALVRHPALAEAYARIEQARGRYVQVGLAPNPYMGYSGQQLGSRGLSEQQGVFIGQDIIRGRKLTLNRQVAEREVNQAEQDAAAIRLRVLTDVRVAFYDVLIAERRRNLNLELVSISEKALKAAEALNKAKEVSRVDVLNAMSAYREAQIPLQNAQNRYQAMWRTLAATINDAQLQPKPVGGNLDGAPLDLRWEDSLQRLLTASPEIHMAVTSLERNRLALQRARAEAIQDINVQGIIQHDQAINNSDGAIQVTMPIKLFNRNQGGIVAAQARIVESERTLERVELDLQHRLASCFERYANARNQVLNYSKEILPVAKESLDLTRAGYEAGEFGILNLLYIQRQYFQYNVSYVEALRELWAATWEIEGFLLNNSLRGDTLVNGSVVGGLANPSRIP